MSDLFEDADHNDDAWIFEDEVPKKKPFRHLWRQPFAQHTANKSGSDVGKIDALECLLRTLVTTVGVRDWGGAFSLKAQTCLYHRDVNRSLASAALSDSFNVTEPFSLCNKAVRMAGLYYSGQHSAAEKEKKFLLEVRFDLAEHALTPHLMESVGQICEAMEAFPYMTQQYSKKAAFSPSKFSARTNASNGAYPNLLDIDDNDNLLDDEYYGGGWLPDEEVSNDSFCGFYNKNDRYLPRDADSEGDEWHDDYGETTEVDDKERWSRDEFVLSLMQQLWEQDEKPTRRGRRPNQTKVKCMRRPKG